MEVGPEGVLYLELSAGHGWGTAMTQAIEQSVDISPF
jgi:hypothetical protein